MYTGCQGIVQDIFTWYQNMGCNGSEIKLANGLKIWVVRDQNMGFHKHRWIDNFKSIYMYKDD